MSARNAAALAGGRERDGHCAPSIGLWSPERRSGSWDRPSVRCSVARMDRPLLLFRLFFRNLLKVFSLLGIVLGRRMDEGWRGSKATEPPPVFSGLVVWWERAKLLIICFSHILELLKIHTSCVHCEGVLIH